MNGAQDPALYTDFDPTKANKGEGAGATADEEGYLEQQEGDPNAVDADDYVPDAAPADDGYLEQKPAGAAEASAPADDGYLEQKPATAGGGDAGARIESPGDVADECVRHLALPYVVVPLALSSAVVPCLDRSPLRLQGIHPYGWLFIHRSCSVHLR